MRAACRTATVLVPVVLAVVASEAAASSAGIETDALVVQAAAGEQNAITITREADAFLVTESDVNLVALEGCDQLTLHSVRCGVAAVREIVVGLEDGDDMLRIEATAPALVTGGDGVDTITGGAGDDLIFGMAGGDTVAGGAGDDRLIELDSERNVLDGGSGIDQVSGGSGDDEIHGGAGDDVLLFGWQGDDLIDGGGGDDVLDTGVGPGPLQPDADRLRGGDGVDRVSYELRADPVQVSMGNGPDDGIFGENDDVAADVERLSGTQGGDRLVGSPSADVLDGSGGADIIAGGGGADQLQGGDEDAAADALSGGPGPDILDGEDGGDFLEGGEDGDRLTGGGGADRLRGDHDADALDGGAGDDALDGGLGPDAMVGAEGIDTVLYAARASAVEVTIDGVANDGEVTPTRDGRTRVEEGAVSEGDNVDPSSERVTGGRAADVVAGNEAANRLDGAGGEDVLVGGGGADTLSGGGRNDAVVSRDRSRDRVTCGSGYDYVVADRRDTVARRGSRCEFVDDGSRTRPIARRDVVVRPRCRGEDAELSPPGTQRAVPVSRRVLAPLGTHVDSLDCAVGLTVATGGGRAGRGRLLGGTGMMRLDQERRGGRVITRMRTTDCRPPGAAPASARAVAARFRRAKYLRRYGRISFPLEARVDAAVMITRRRVVSWEVDDRCGRSATIRVSSGRLAVLDLGRDRRVVLEPGDQYTAMAP